jgi:hypothetical protein
MKTSMQIIYNIMNISSRHCSKVLSKKISINATAKDIGFFLAEISHWWNSCKNKSKFWQNHVNLKKANQLTFTPGFETSGEISRKWRKEYLAKIECKVPDKTTARLLLRTTTETSKARNRHSWVLLDSPPPMGPGKKAIRSNFHTLQTVKGGGYANRRGGERGVLQSKG